MKIIAGVIGMGVGEKHFEAIENHNKCSVKIICEKNKKKIKFLKKKYPKKIITPNEDDIFFDKEINLVSIASYDNFHFQHVKKGLENKKHLIVEKPLCLNLNELKKIFQLVKKNKKINITSNLVLRTNSLFNYFKKNINNKDLFYIEGDYIWGRKHKLFGWRSNIKDYSLILGAAIHIIDLAMWFTNLKPKYVTVFKNKKITKKSKFKKPSFYLMIFEFPKNIIVKITANAVAKHNHFHEIKVFTKNQTFVNTNLGSYSYSKNLKIINNAYPDKKNRKKLIKNFLNVLMNSKTKPIISMKEQLDLMSAGLAAVEASKICKRVKIEYLK
jgi:predicted dehydrogenase